MKSNKVALVTGSGQRIGRYIALALADIGYDVAICYHRSAEGAMATKREVTKKGVKAIVVKADIRVRRDVKRMITKVYGTMGRLDLLVNNAAIFPEATPFLSVSDHQWNNVLQTNLTSHFMCSQEAGKFMSKQKQGKIINIASLGASVAWKDHSAYCVSKAALVMLTKVMAKALAPAIQVNAIAPGSIRIPGETGKKHLSPWKIPLACHGNPDDITRAVIFLAEHAEYLTGQVINVDGGASLL